MPNKPTHPCLSIEIALSPAFHDLDPMDIVWHGNYPKYLEIARCALLSQFNYDYPQMKASGYAWPIVDMRLKYVKPARFEQKLIVRAEITEWESRLKINYLIKDAVSGQKINQAHTIQVAVDMNTGEMQYVCPAILWERLGVEEPQ
ncbi:acyl-CoA thioesterase [Iodobacter fluviatilis]|uniref:Acyl-CoA thioester hydrolase n=1 Tax=Iodobacter fluviatilis TaxID=537 RepID=A0A377Q8X6_9NEIS|nr:acyl-CoA thioesterase [Iodobacter fluviatilis]TCU88597.1 acyl-CoA thioester hydrolase [Iodobacter fluviatilis]STQ91332.1 Acyl-CoA thioester hydrolase YbgC [Iodobacter fluviatilis]